MIEVSDQQYSAFVGYIRDHYGIYFKPEKKCLLLSRLQPILSKLHINNLDEYLDYVQKDSCGRATLEMLDKLTTNHSYFLREPSHFTIMQNLVIPYLKQTVESKDLRIWCAGCATGEEAYTLAMLLHSVFNLEKHHWDTTILATDISMEALKQAKLGVYPKERLRDIPDNWLKRYFKLTADGLYAVRDFIKQDVVFTQNNLLDPIPFRKQLHVIFCRNVMIYFDQETKEQLVQRFYNCTQPGGFLFIGRSETLTPSTSNYKIIVPSVFRKE